MGSQLDRPWPASEVDFSSFQKFPNGPAALLLLLFDPGANQEPAEKPSTLKPVPNAQTLSPKPRP